MKKIIVSVLAFFLLLAGCSVGDSSSIPQNREVLPYENASTFGVWISFSEINAMLKSEDGFKTEFDKAVENCKALKNENF